jgi:hypothetical protein
MVVASVRVAEVTRKETGPCCAVYLPSNSLSLGVGGRTKEISVAQGATSGPRPVSVGELDPLAQGRVTRAPEPVEETRSGQVEILLLQPHERQGSSPVVASELEAEPIGLVLHPP